MKFSLDWHRAGISNLLLSTHQTLLEIQELRRRYNRQADDLEFAKRQFAEAEKRGLKAYDADKLLVPKGKRRK